MEGEENLTDGGSVGRALSANRAFSTEHPYYRSLLGQVESRVAALAADKGEKRAAAALSFVTVALGNEDTAVLAELFPEFRYVFYPFHKPAHALFVQVRRSAMEWVFLQATRVAPAAVLCLGAPLLAALETRLDRVTMLVDSASPVMVHERHAMSMDAYKVYSDVVSVAQDTGRSLSREAYNSFLTGKGKVTMTAAWTAGAQADALCVDGMVAAFSPVQVAVAMGCAGAEVAYGTLPYHHSMLLNAEGELPGFGVHYSRSADGVSFRYPEGVAGVVRYGYDEWRSWLVGHSFSVGRLMNKRWYQLELLKERGCVLFWRMVALPKAPRSSELVHSLELAAGKPMYLISSMRLKGVGSDPTDRDSWGEVRYLVPKRLLDRVYQFAMQLPREQFTRYAIRKQLHVVNDRVTIEGTTVRVNSALGVAMVDALVVDIYTRAYVDRYDAGELTMQARSYVDSQVAFASYTRSEKLWFIATACTVSAWDASASSLGMWVRQAADAVRRWFAAGPALSPPAVRVAPSYLLVGKHGENVCLDGGVAMAREVDRQAALSCDGLFSDVVRLVAERAQPPVDILRSTFRVEAFAAFTVAAAADAVVDRAVDMIKALNPIDEAPFLRRQIEVVTAVRAACAERAEDFNPVADAVYVLNEMHGQALPGVAEQNLEYDTASISLDPQDRVLMAPYMRLPRYFGDAPKPKSYYRSRLKALDVPKRQQTMQELLSSIAARNLNAPQVGLPQDDESAARSVWETFLDKACVPDAREKLARYQRDVVSLSEDAFREWATQSSAEKIARVAAELEESAEAMAEMSVSEYLVMLKADAKPSLSKKPLDQRTEPQVIVYHEKAVSALYSSIFRVLVRRFLSLLRPNYHVCLLKDVKDMESFVRGVHPFGVEGLKYLENDFSKYDKSQGRFVWVLEQLVFRELGMNEEFLAKWLGGHVKCSMRALGMGLSLHVMYQRKSGDATTSFGNTILNVLSVVYAYSAAVVVWALFMGDDSLLCVTAVGAPGQAVQVLAEVFNLGAKSYLTDAPYFASNFILIDSVNELVAFVPDPVKRVERWSMAVSASDPQWHERYVSACDSLAVYRNCAKTAMLARCVSQRYDVSEEWCRGAPDAVATLLSSEQKFRSIWEEFPVLSVY